MKIVCWNIESARRCLPALPALVAAQGSPEVVCLQELGIRGDETVAIEAMCGTLPGYRCHYAFADDPHNVTFRGGRMYGVATFVRGRWRGEVPAWDREGRVLVVRKPGLAVVNVYAVNGTAKPYFDEAGRPAGDRHAFKRRFQAQVMDLGRELRAAGGVVMAGDWNVSPTRLDTHPRLRTEEPHASARAELQQRARAEGFVDVWRSMHHAERAYTWFNRRARGLDAARVDYILVSEDLVSRVEAAAILEPLPCSDHAPLSVQLRMPLRRSPPKLAGMSAGSVTHRTVAGDEA
jgi:exodeoxyribonuclease III